jgi:hypothetical protein
MWGVLFLNRGKTEVIILLSSCDFVKPNFSCTPTAFKCVVREHISYKCCWKHVIGCPHHCEPGLPSCHIRLFSLAPVHLCQTPVPECGFLPSFSITASTFSLLYLSWDLLPGSLSICCCYKRPRNFLCSKISSDSRHKEWRKCYSPVLHSQHDSIPSWRSNKESPWTASFPNWEYFMYTNHYHFMICLSCSP